MLLHPFALLRLLRLGVEQPDDAVGIAHRGHLWIGDNDRRIGKSHCKRCTSLYSSGAITKDPIELGAHFFDDACDARLGKGVLVAGL